MAIGSIRNPSSNRAKDAESQLSSSDRRILPKATVRANKRAATVRAAILQGAMAEILFREPYNRARIS
eukprot:767880-Hanusia_phi.AAC.3